MPDTYAAIESARAELEAGLIPRVEGILRAHGRRIAAIAARGTYEWETTLGADSEAADPKVAMRLVETVWFATAQPFAEAQFRALREQKRRYTFDWLEVVRQFLADEGAAMVVGISEHTRELVRAILREGIERGEGARALARRLRQEWPAITRVRAERIVRTEVIAASGHGAMMGAQAAAEAFGMDMEAEWLATNDGRTRDSHAEANGQRVPLGATFSIGGFPARYPADPMLPAAQRVNCRCAAVFVPAGEAKSREWPSVRRRREAVWAEYPDLRDRHGREIALDRLAERHGTSARSIERDWEVRPR